VVPLGETGETLEGEGDRYDLLPSPTQGRHNQTVSGTVVTYEGEEQKSWMVALANTYRRRLREVALDQYGFVTTRDAERIEVPTQELRKLEGRGGMEHLAYGLYRFDDICPWPVFSPRFWPPEVRTPRGDVQLYVSLGAPPR
jgi:hypothetical protein